MDYRFTVVHRGLSDVFLRHADPSVKIGVVAKVKNGRRGRNWVFLPLKSFRAQFPVTGFVFGRDRGHAVFAYMNECKSQLCDVWWDSREVCRQLVQRCWPAALSEGVTGDG